MELILRYRRVIWEGGTYFFTINLLNRSSGLLTKHISLLRKSFKYVKQRHHFEIDAIVILPDHIHLILSLPQHDGAYSMRLNLIKAYFSRNLELREEVSESRQRKRERGIWQRRFWEHHIGDEEDFNNHVDYIHYNPVKHGYVKVPSQWAYSSIHRYIAQGILPLDWAGNNVLETKFGE